MGIEKLIFNVRRIEQVVMIRMGESRNLRKN